MLFDIGTIVCMADKTETKTLSELLSPHARQAEADLDRWLVEDGTPAALAQAMRYCVLGGGKRLRPALAYMAAQAVGGQVDECVRRSAVAVELVHCYSLVHDDLPAMDNDVLRRGLPTAHVKFGQAMAILAGDALLTRAFGVLAPTGRAGQLVAELALGAGAAGMIAGQVADMNLCDVPAGLEGLDYIHLRKTAALIRSAVRMGAICAGACVSALSAVSEYGEKLGRAFQLMDDLLDVTGEAGDLGKAVQKDAQAGKRTHASELGLERAGAMGMELTEQAVKAIKPLGEKAADLCCLAQLLARRRH